MLKSLIIPVLLSFQIQLLAQDETTHKTELDIPYYPDSMQTDDYIRNRCRLDIHYPANIRDFATVVWFHGGGLQEGEKFFPEELMFINLCIVSVNYRLHPKVTAPAYIRDAAAAVAWVFDNIEKYGGDAKRIYISGHSAGGYLTSLIGLDKQWLEIHGIDANRIAGLIPLSGQTVTHSTIRKEMELRDTKIIVDVFAPLNHIRKDAPPLLLITGDREMDIPGRYEENLLLKRMMQYAGHEETQLHEMQGYGHMMLEPAFPLLIREIERISKN
jgi:acetyl esterase/lipase